MDKATANPSQVTLTMASYPAISRCRVQHDLARHASPSSCQDMLASQGWSYPHSFTVQPG